MPGRLDAIVVVYRRMEFLPRLFDALGEVTRSVGGKLIVVDNGNEGNSLAELEALVSDSDAIIVKFDENVNYGIALNRAVLESDADNILISHSDAVPAHGCVERMLEVVGDYDAVMPYTNHSHVSGAVVVTSRSYGRLASAARGSKTVAVSLSADTIASVAPPRENAVVDGIDTFFVMLRREVADSIGRFDERIFHHDRRLDENWWISQGSERFQAAVAGGSFCFHYGGFTVEDVLPRIVADRTNDLILSGGSGSENAQHCNEPADEMRNAVFRFDAEARRVSGGPVFGKPIHLIHIGTAEQQALDQWRSVFESATTLMPEADTEEYSLAIENCDAEWVMVMRSGEHVHDAALAGIKRLTLEPYDAVEFPFLLCDPEHHRCLLSQESGTYPFAQVRLFRRDSGCTIQPSDPIVCLPDNASVRKADRISGDAVLQHIFRTGSWSGRWIDTVPNLFPSTMTGEPPKHSSAVSILTLDNQLNVAIGVATLDLKKPIHQPSYMASFGFRDSVSAHPNVLRVDCFDGSWGGRAPKNDRVYIGGEKPHIFLSVDELRQPPPIKDCAHICWITTARFSKNAVTPSHVASLGYDKYFCSSHRFCDELRDLDCNCDFLTPGVLSKPQRQFTKISTRCQVGMILRANPAEWDAQNLSAVIARLKDVNCRIFGHGWGNTGAIKQDIAKMPRPARARAMAVLDETLPLVGSAMGIGQESVIFSGMRCLLHVPSPIDAEWGFMPYSICDALVVGTPVVLLDSQGWFSHCDFGSAPIYIERTAADAAQRVVSVASMSFDDLEILANRAAEWVAENSHDHRAASILSSITVHPGKPARRQMTLRVSSATLDEKTTQMIRSYARLRGISQVDIENNGESADGFLADFMLDSASVRVRLSTSPSSAQIDSIIASLGLD